MDQFESNPPKPAPSTELREQILACIDRSTAILADPGGPVFQVLAEALGNHSNRFGIDPAQAFLTLRTALQKATGETKETIARNLRALSSDPQHPNRGGDVALILYDAESDPVARRGIITESLQSPHHDVCGKGVWFVQERVSELMLRNERKQALEEYSVYASDIFDILVRFGGRKELPATMRVHNLHTDIHAIEPFVLLESGLRYGESALIAAGKGEIGTLQQKLTIALGAACGHGNRDFITDIIDLGLAGKYPRCVAHLLNRLGAAMPLVVLDRVAADPTNDRVMWLPSVLMNMGVHTISHVTLWCEQNPAARLSLALYVASGFATVAFVSPPRNVNPETITRLKDWMRGERVLDRILEMAEDGSWEIVEQARALKSIVYGSNE